jgi:bacterioferritin-associated ferredoxin
MIVCSCNVLSDGVVRACIEPGPDCPRTVAQVYKCLGCSQKCGRCAKTIRAIIEQALGDVQAGCGATSGVGQPGQGEPALC